MAVGWPMFCKYQVVRIVLRPQRQVDTSSGPGARPATRLAAECGAGGLLCPALEIRHQCWHLTSSHRPKPKACAPSECAFNAATRGSASAVL